MARTAAVVLGVLSLFILIWQARDVVLLAFAALLLAVAFGGLAGFVAKRSRLSYHWALGLSLGILLSALILGGYLGYPHFADQMDQVTEEFPQALDNLTEGLRETSWGPMVIQQVRRFEGNVTRGPELFQRFTGVASLALGLVTNAVVVFFLGLYFAAQPQLYKKGLLRLVPQHNRDRLGEIFHEVAEVLGWWLWGKIVAMFLIGVATWIGLTALGVPLPFLLAVIAALLTFIPNFGPVFSAIPAMILGFAESLWMGVWVALLYLGIQVLESYVITPIIQRKAVDLPPALILISQVVLGLLMGFLGLLLATPLAAAGLVLTRRLWIEGAMGEDIEAGYGPDDGDPVPAG